MSSMVPRVGRLRKAMAVAIAAVAVLLTQGCTPAAVPIIAVRLDDQGRPSVIIHACPGHELYRISIYDGAGTASWSATAEELNNRFEEPMFHLRNGWKSETSTLEKLTPATSYGASISGGDFPYSTVSFTLEDLQALKRDEVVTLAANGSREQTMSRADFERNAESTC